MKLTIGQKAMRCVVFLLGLRNAQITRIMARHGLSPEERQRGWRLVQELASGRLSAEESQNPKVLRQLDEWENLWFPIIEATLRARFPDVHALVFRNLAQSSGAAVVMVVRTLIDRIDGLDRPVAEGGIGEAEAARVRALLAARGIDEATLAEGRAMLETLATPEVDETPSISREEEEAAEKAMWSWYLEWSAIARAVITDRRQLRMLGYRRNTSGQVVEDPSVVEPTDGEPSDDTEPFTA